MGQAEKIHAIGTSSLDGQFGVRKALSEDLFAMNYSYPPPVSGWYSGSPYVAAVPMHYNAPMVLVHSEFHASALRVNSCSINN